MYTETDISKLLVFKLRDIVNSLELTIIKLSQQLANVLASDAIEQASFNKHNENKIRKRIYPIIELALNNNEYCSGAGFASYLSSYHHKQPYWLLEWWFKGNASQPNEALELNQTTQQRLDFSTFYWFKQSLSLQRPYLYGPYVDYICTANYTLTAASPVVVAGENIGVAAMDVLVGTLETELLTILCQSDKGWIITNSERRIIVSNLATYRVGMLLPLSYGTQQQTVGPLLLHLCPCNPR